MKTHLFHNLCKLYYIKLRPIFLISHYTNYSTTSAAEPLKRKKNEHHIFEIKTGFAYGPKLKCNRAHLDQQLAISGRLNELYTWQKKNRKQREIFELLDGPPYANGSVHVGHAINKILKDFIIKSQIALGKQVLFRPGWDCHGLPIELKIRKDVKDKSDIEIRELAMEVAQQAIDKQKQAFRRWGVSADWLNPYITMNADYVAKELRLFGELLKKGLVYRKIRPVHWSPSSQTALAESELEYYPNHKSLSCFFRFKMISRVPFTELKLPHPDRPQVVYALIWTTTPWTLPVNDAICVKSDVDYCGIQFEDEKNYPINSIYLVARALVPELQGRLGRMFNIVGLVSGKELENLYYQSCWYNELGLPIYTASHVSLSKGTGLVHTAFAHGTEDYQVSLLHDRDVHCFVDAKGQYTRNLGYKLEGKDVLTSGQSEVLRILSKDVVATSILEHSYPYDWRTKKPVLVRATSQWFIDTLAIGHKAVGFLTNIHVGAGKQDQSEELRVLLLNRSEWCISRQRVWGVPIPAFRDDQGNVYSSNELCQQAATAVENYGIHAWWKVPESELLNEKVLTSLNLPSTTKELNKSYEVMDVWMDSGLAWACARHNYEDSDGRKIADVILEGVDQSRGWFNSLLLTSAALQDFAPFKRILVHGFCLDDEGKKMSKSLGNVVDPETVTDGTLRSKALGADGLRLWVALHGAEGSQASRIGPKILEDIDFQLTKLRKSFYFLLGSIHNYENQKPARLPILDQIVLYELHNLLQNSIKLYKEYQFKTLVQQILSFAQEHLSKNYVHYVHDRLYVEAVGSEAHLAAQFTMAQILTIMSQIIMPILPHLVIELATHRKDGNPEEALRFEYNVYDSTSEQFSIQLDENLPKINLLIKKIRGDIAKLTGEQGDPSKTAVFIDANSASYKILEKLNPVDGGNKTELTELLGVSEVYLRNGGNITDVMVRIEKPKGTHCVRCRRMRKLDDRSKYCTPCNDALVTMGIS